jgi:hypothetical protein
VDEQNVETPQVETNDRRAILEQGFEQAEKGEPIEPTAPWDDQGRFAKGERVRKEPEPQPQEEADPPVWARPPASWKKEYHEIWQKADPKMREYAWQREEQMRAGVEPLLSKAQFADAMQEAISPYMQTIQGLGLTPDKAVAALMDADHKLRNSNPQERLAYFYQLAQSYGINLSAAQGQQPQAAQPTIDPMVYQLQQELNKVRGEVTGWKQQQEIMENQTLLNEINQFSMKAEYFEEVRPAMISLLQSGMAQTLDEAYEKAIRLDPNLFEQVQQAKQAEVVAKQAKEANRAAKAARAAAVSVRSATPGVNTAPKAANRRAILEEAFSETESRL